MLNVLSFRPSFFDVVERSGKAFLKWGVPKEINLSTVTVERSTDAVNFKTVSVTDSKDFMEDGDIKVYDFIETLPSGQSKVSYRIRFVDFTGAQYYSEVKSLRYGPLTSVSMLRIYPNPVANNIHIQLPSSANNAEIVLEIADMFGKILLQNKIAASQTLISFDMSRIPSGTYFLKVVSKGMVFNQQVIKN